MAEEFENTSQDTQADVKGAGTMLAAPFEIAKQDTLLEVQQTTMETKNKIGNPGDEGEDTLFGLLNPGNKPEEKADLYRYSKTEIKKQILNWKPNLSGSTTFYGKLTTFRAEKNGTVYVKWTSSDKANGEFYIYHKAPLSILEAPDQSELGSSIPKGLQQEDFCYYHINYVYSSNKGNPTTFEWVFPVIAGIDYTFMLCIFCFFTVSE